MAPSARPAKSTPGDLALHCGKVSGFVFENATFPFLRVRNCVLVLERQEIETPGCCNGKNRSGEQGDASGACAVVADLGCGRTCNLERKS